MTRHAPRTTTSHGARPAAPHGHGARGGLAHPWPLPMIAIEADGAPDQPFAEGARDALDPDLRHRLISEAAFRRYAERGYEDGYDVDDWLQAEADVDHVLLGRGGGA